jgi:putative membrane protein
MASLLFLPLESASSPGLSWNLNLTIVVPLVLAAALYTVGTGRLWKRAGRGHGITAVQCLRFVGAMLALIAAFLSPLDGMSEALFSAHMVQHQLLILAAAPLLATSGFSLAIAWALPRQWAQSIGHALNRTGLLPGTWKLLSKPASAWVLFAAGLWLWHAPLLYQAALENEALHILEHVVFLSTSILFWWVLFKHTSQQHLHYGMAFVYLFTSGLQSEILAALMTFTGEPWYSFCASSAQAWGLSPMQDQQLAGLIMWFPGSLVFTLLTIGYFAAWLRSLEARASRPHQGHSPAARKE